MAQVQTRTKKGLEVPEALVEAFRSTLRGRLLSPGDADYEEARKVWNGMIDRRPALIARCAGAADVINAVNFARDNGLLLAVRGGGHNIAGNAVCDDGLVIDLSSMKSVRVNPRMRRAYVEPGATLGDFDLEAQAFGLATPLGINSTTGVAGLTLGGGFGWLSRKYGMTIDNLVSADVVTADGQLITASSEQNPDLFWAIRGGGGNFGIVTCFEFQLHPVGPEVLAGLIVFPFEEAKSVLTQWREIAETMPDEMSVWAVMRKAPPLPFLPAEVHGQEVIALAILYAGDVNEGMHMVEALRKFGKAHGEHVGPMPYRAWQQILDPLLTPGARNYWKSHNFSRFSDEAIDCLIDYAGRLPDPQCEIPIALLGGQAGRVEPEATAYSHRDARFVLNVHGRWDNAEKDQQCISWARDLFRSMAPYATGGVYVNFLTQDETDRIGAAYGENYQRLREIKRKYDPTNLFHINQNIQPNGR